MVDLRLAIEIYSSFEQYEVQSGVGLGGLGGLGGHGIAPCTSSTCNLL